MIDYRKALEVAQRECSTEERTRSFTMLEAAVEALLATPPVPCVEWNGKDVDALLAAFERDKASAIRAARKEALEEAATTLRAMDPCACEVQPNPKCQPEDRAPDYCRGYEDALFDGAKKIRALSGSEDKNTTQEGGT